MKSEVSGFFAPAGIYDVSEEKLTLIHSSEEGFYELYRGERAGQFRVFKCLKPEFRGDLLQETMLQKEFEIGFPLRHAGICETYSYTQVDTLGNCIEMEWIDGRTLEEYLQGTKPDNDSFCRMAEELCDAISYLHAHQVVHRDIKPSNIMVTHQGTFLKLIDFSLADSSSHAMLKQPAGTVSYAAPEVLAGQIADQRSDIYSLGKVLMRMTSRHKGVLARCTNGNPAKRYASAEKLKAALLRKQRIWPLLLVVLLAVGIAVLALRPSPEAQTPTLPPAVEGAVHDNTTENEAKTAVDEGKTGSRERKPAPAGRPDIGTGDIDAIFNEASDLFE